MSVSLVVDMNLSVEWVTELTRHGWPAIHWSMVGDPTAPDAKVMAWALDNGHFVFTHDLDFGTMLALTHAAGPSVLQVRGQNVLPEDIGLAVIAALRQQDDALAAGALVVVDLRKTCVRVLPWKLKISICPFLANLRHRPFYIATIPAHRLKALRSRCENQAVTTAANWTVTAFAKTRASSPVHAPPLARAATRNWAGNRVRQNAGSPHSDECGSSSFWRSGSRAHRPDA